MCTNALFCVAFVVWAVVYAVLERRVLETRHATTCVPPHHAEDVLHARLQLIVALISSLPLLVVHGCMTSNIASRLVKSNKWLPAPTAEITSEWALAGDLNSPFDLL